MGKIKRKLKSVSPYNIEEFESWLSYNAGRGLFLYEIGEYFCRFKKGEPKKMEYRVDLVFEKSSYEKIQLYKDAGWEFVNNNAKAYVFCSPSEEKAIEIYTDKDELRLLLSKLARKQLLYSLLFSLYLIALFAFVINISLRSDTLYLDFISSFSTNSTLGFLFISLLGLVLFNIYQYKQFNRIRKLKNKLLKGGDVNHHRKWGYKISLERLIPVITLTIIFFPAFINLTVLIYSTSGLSIDNSKETLISISEVETDLTMHNKTVYKDISLLCTDVYSSYENGFEKKTNQEVNLDLEYYEVRFGFWAEGLVEDLVADYKKTYTNFKPDINFDVQEIPSDFFDKVYYLECQASSEFFIRKDNIVAHISYTGTQTKETFLERLEDSTN